MENKKALSHTALRYNGKTSIITEIMLEKCTKAIGLMSGTSSDGVDVAYIDTDGQEFVFFGPSQSFLYPRALRDRLISTKMDDTSNSVLEKDLTLFHFNSVKKFMEINDLNKHNIDLVGFHGHTIYHNPGDNITIQMGDGQLLAKHLEIPVINDFRSEDVKNGGQGAPLVPIFHSVLAKKLKKPLAILNIGGVANVTWVDKQIDKLMAFDVGPGNAMIDDWVYSQGLGDYDKNGSIAAKGSVNLDILNQYLSNDFFQQKPPKSLDRNSFSLELVKDLTIEDATATLSEFTTESVRNSQVFFPSPVTQWIVCGGGRLNGELMRMLEVKLDAPVVRSEEVGWDGDALEAQAFAFLAVRSMLKLPLSFPNTTGVKNSTVGGVLNLP